MNFDLGAIVLLIMAAMLFIGFPALIISLIVRKARNNKGLTEFANKHSWQSPGDDSEETQSLYHALESGFFATRSGKHSLKQVIQGVRESHRFWMCRYHNRVDSAGSESGMKTKHYSLLVLPCAQTFSDVHIQHKQSGVLAKFAKALAGSKLIEHPDPEWSWAWVSSTEGVDLLPLKSGAPASLKAALRTGDIVMFTAQTIVVAHPNDNFRTADADALLKTLDSLISIVEK